MNTSLFAPLECVSESSWGCVQRDATQSYIRSTTYSFNCGTHCSSNPQYGVADSKTGQVGENRQTKLQYSVVLVPSACLHNRIPMLISTKGKRVLGIDSGTSSDLVGHYSVVPSSHGHVVASRLDCVRSIMPHVYQTE